MSAADKQAMFERAMTVRHEQAADEHVAGLPAGALGFAALADLDVEELTDSEIVRMVADVFDLTILEAVNRIAAIDFDTARALAEAN